MGALLPIWGLDPISMQMPRMRPRGDSLIRQVVAANVVLVTLTVFAASLAAGLDLSIGEQRWQFVVLALVIALTFCVNLWMLQRRFGPLERLIDQIERIDPAEPATFELAGDPVKEINRLAESFRRLLRRVHDERSRSGKLVLRAQEEERRRVARDLHDEVNQALAAILLRLEALAQDSPPEHADEVAELKRLASQAMDQLLSLARVLRPAALDDHGLVPALATQIATFGERTGIRSTFQRPSGDFPKLSDEEQLVIYRVTQESLSNVAQHAGASRVDVELNFVGRTVLRVRDDGRGFMTVNANGRNRLGVSGMRERALLVGGNLSIFSTPGEGTTIELTMGAT